MDILVIIIIFAVIVVLVGLMQGKDIEEKMKLKNSNKDKAKYRIEKILDNLDNFKVYKQKFNSDYSRGIVIDDTYSKLALIKNSNKEPCRVISFKDILSVEIVEDGETKTQTVTKTNRGSQVAGALVGGLLLGGAGAIIGGLSGKKESISTGKSQVKNIDLKILINDTETPVFELNLYNKNRNKGKPEYILNIAKIWYDLITVMINRADTEKENINVLETLPNINISISDEIRKLKALQDDGLITDEEFTTQKEKLFKQ